MARRLVGMIPGEAARAIVRARPPGRDQATMSGRALEVDLDARVAGNDTATPVGAIASGGGNQRWFKFVHTYDQWSIAATLNLITLMLLPPKWTVHGCIIYHTTAFSGPGITDVKLRVGISGDDDKYASDFDVDTAPGPTNFSVTDFLFVEDMENQTAITCDMTTTGADIDQLNAGVVEIYLLLGKL